MKPDRLLEVIEIGDASQGDDAVARWVERWLERHRPGTRWHVKFERNESGVAIESRPGQVGRSGAGLEEDEPPVAAEDE